MLGRDLRGSAVSVKPPLLAALYLNFGDRTIPWEFNGWKPESLALKTGCFIHAGLSGTQVDFQGPDFPLAA